MASRLAICLFDESVTEIDISKLLGGQPLSKVTLTINDNDSALYLKKSADSKPEWVDIVKGFSSINTSDTMTASSGAILFLKIQDRIFGCCFGTSVANINKDNMERDFGLAIAYYRIPKGKYKGMETYTLAENPITNNRSVAMPSSRNSFNIDNYLETITELSGKYFLSSRNVLIKGKEFFSTPSPLNFGDIRDLCTKLLNEYATTINDDTFKKLTAVHKVKTQKLIDYLNEKLCDSLNKKLTTVYLVDYQQFDDLTSYSFTPKGEKLPGIEITDLYESLNKNQKFDIDSLKTKKISVYDSSDQHLDDWSLYKCLFTQISIDIGGYIFYKGNWYEVQSRYIDDLKSIISSREIDPSTLKLSQWNNSDDEGIYNTNLAKKIGGQCWDCNYYTHTDYSYGIEFCDILLPNYIMHVKKSHRSSLTSHLLMQTYVSAQLLKSDIGLKKWIKEVSKKKFKKNLLLKASDEFKDPPIKYLIVFMSTNKTKTLADTLPFFTLITLNMIVRRIEELDFAVELCKV